MQNNETGFFEGIGWLLLFAAMIFLILTAFMFVFKVIGWIWS